MANAKTNEAAATNDEGIGRLLNMLTYKRPHKSESEVAFIEAFIEPIKGKVDSYRVDSFGNIFATIGTSKTLFTAHTDTVHRTSGTQLIMYDHACGLVYKQTGKDAADTECLGADDGAGVALLLEMIDAGVPGCYAFFRAEERGGQGSSYVVKADPEFLKQFDRAVAFDRRGSTSVITHQGYGRCCSDEFAAELCYRLNAVDKISAFTPDDGGIFTDTANFTELIPECTNVSVGYENEHGVNELLDVEYWLILRAAVLTIDWESLPTKRDPKVADTYSFGGGLYDYADSQSDEVMQMGFGKLLKWIKASKPEDIAEVIFEMTDRIYAMQDEMVSYQDNGIPDSAYNNYMEDDDDLDARFAS